MDAYLEIGSKRVFACAVHWVGWTGEGKTEALAVEALEQSRARYAKAVHKRPEGEIKVVERVPGNATTDFGAPGVPPQLDRVRITKAAGENSALLLKRAWAHLDAVAAKSPAELRKGPRGGGRDRDKMLQHVLGAEVMYARAIGVRFKEPAFDDAKAIKELRDAILEVVGGPSSPPPAGEKGWPVRYAARRMAWHVLFHAWEMEDRAT